MLAALFTVCLAPEEVDVLLSPLTITRSIAVTMHTSTHQSGHHHHPEEVLGPWLESAVTPARAGRGGGPHLALPRGVWQQGPPTQDTAPRAPLLAEECLRLRQRAACGAGPGRRVLTETV